MSLSGQTAPATLELTAGTVATDWTVATVHSNSAYGYGQAYTTFTYKATGETVKFAFIDRSGVNEAPVTVRFGAGGPTQSVAEFRSASAPLAQPLLLQGTEADEALLGGVLNDTLNGLGGNDTLTGGVGNDVIDAGAGQNLVRYALGDGDDTVTVDGSGYVSFQLDGPFLPGDIAVEQRVDGYRVSFGALPGSLTILGDVTDLPFFTDFVYGSGANTRGGFTLDEFALIALPGTQQVGLALTGSDGADTLLGKAGRDTLSGGAGADVLAGGSGHDIYQGGAGDDFIIDHPVNGDQRLVRGQPLMLGGNDTYLFNRGDGVDTVIDTGNANNSDILQFGAGISLADIELVRRSVVGALDSHSPSITTALPQLDYEIYRIKGTSDEIRFTADIAEGSPGPEWLRFADGTVVQASQLEAGAAAPVGMQATGTSQAEVVRGTTQADTLTGGLGNDTLLGGTGSDLYVYTIGDGADLIQESQSNGYGSDVDTLALHGALSLSNMKFHREIVAIEYPVQLTTDTGITIEHHTEYLYTDVIDLGAGKDQIQVSWEQAPDVYYTDLLDPSRSLGVLEWIKLDNGQSLTGAELTQRVVAGGLNIRGHEFGNALSGALGQDFIDAGSGDDRLFGEAGNDTLNGNGGNDQLSGGLGNDLLTGGAGADTYSFSVGDGADTVQADGSDTVQLGVGLTRSDVLIGKLGESMANAVVLQLGKGSTDSITLSNAGTWSGLQVKLGDGSVITGADIMAEATKPADLTVQGSINADSLKGGAGNDTLNGLAGNDTLLGADGQDVLTGGLGSDVLDGGAGADTYKFSVGDGSDTIHADGLDTIVLGAGLTKANVQIGKLGAKVANAVVLGVGSNAADTITLDNAGSWAGLQLKFADGSSLTGADILLAATKPDNLTLNGSTKADVLTGKDGNDTLNGLAGNDTLAGGKGNDSLVGGKGNDTYLFNRGDGQDVIVDTDSTLFNSDLLKLGGATSKQLWLTKSGSDLSIKILGTQDKVTVQNWFAGSANQVEKITASDGKSLSASKVNALVNAMASFTPPADAASLPANTPAAVTKLIASSWA
jgi:Ca2+-binding RTX toxin-like protein